jgi:hypothetical protein
MTAAERDAATDTVTREAYSQWNAHCEARAEQTAAKIAKEHVDRVASMERAEKKRQAAEAEEAAALAKAHAGDMSDLLARALAKRGAEQYTADSTGNGRARGRGARGQTKRRKHKGSTSARGRNAAGRGGASGAPKSSRGGRGDGRGRGRGRAGRRGRWRGGR